MSQITPIEWTDMTWNPTKGCSRISPGCKNCYAEKIAARFSTHSHQDGNIPGGIFAGFAIMKNHEAHWTGKVELIESKLLEPLHWRKPRRVFVNSMSDLFHENLDQDAISRIFSVMAMCPQHTFQILTKRADVMQDYCARAAANPDAYLWAWVGESEWPRGTAKELPNWGKWPLPNVHLGVSIENQPTADLRIPKLLATPASVRFVSYEPALEGANLMPWLYRSVGSYMADGSIGTRPRLDWVIIGGESGPGARPFDIEWGRHTIRQCKAAGVPVFVKQLGSVPVKACDGNGCGICQRPHVLYLKDRKGGNMEEWPPDLRIREFPKVA